MTGVQQKVPAGRVWPQVGGRGTLRGVWPQAVGSRPGVDALTFVNHVPDFDLHNVVSG